MHAPLRGLHETSEVRAKREMIMKPRPLIPIVPKYRRCPRCRCKLKVLFNCTNPGEIVAYCERCKVGWPAKLGTPPAKGEKE